MTTNLTAELKRRTVGGGIADWTLTPDVDSPNGLSDPMADYGARDRIEAVKASVDEVVTALENLSIDGEVVVTGGATETTLQTVLTTLSTISADLTDTLTVSGTVSVGNHPANFPLPTAQVADLKNVSVVNQRTDYPLPAAQFEALKAPASQTVSGTVQVTNHPTDFPSTGTVSRINALIAEVQEVEAIVTTLLKPGGSVQVGNLPTTYPDTAAHGRLDTIQTKLDGVVSAIEDLLKPGQSIEVSNFPVDPETGNWGYLSGTDALALAVPGRVLTISLVAIAPGATLTIGGGDPIPVLPRFPFTITPKGNLATPVLDIVGTEAYFIEYVT